MNVFIDNNVWNYFYDNKVNIPEVFPKNEFTLLITYHGEYEVKQMGDSYPELSSYIRDNLSANVGVDRVFGFRNDSLPSNEQRIVGFNQGRFTSINESKIRNDLYKKYGSKIKRKETQILFNQEADIELASRSKDHIVISFDEKKGPLKEAYDNGGNIIFLNYKESCHTPVDEFLKSLRYKIKQLKR